MVLDGDTWKVENVAYRPDRDNRLRLHGAQPNDDGTLGPHGAQRRDQRVRPRPPAPSTSCSTAARREQADTAGIAADEPFALHDPGDDLAPGPHQLVVVAVGDDGTIASYGGTFTVEG